MLTQSLNQWKRYVTNLAHSPVKTVVSPLLNCIERTTPAFQSSRKSSAGKTKSMLLTKYLIGGAN